jgi:8-oxo-dGTP pyrophosphatase MutT (NUDIX family)
VRECEEETGIVAEVTGFLGVYSDPEHIVAYTDGEVRQEHEVTLIGRATGGAPASNEEACDVGWFLPGELAGLDIHPTMRRQIDDYLTGDYPHVD